MVAQPTEGCCLNLMSLYQKGLTFHYNISKPILNKLYYNTYFGVYLFISVYNSRKRSLPKTTEKGGMKG